MYKAQKSVEAAAFFLRHKKAQTMPYYDLVKLLYLADREQVRLHGRTISGDTHWSLPWGPVLGSVLDAVRHGNDEVWNRHISTDKRAKTSTLLIDAPAGELSRFDIEVLESIWKEFGHFDGPALMMLTHRLPEYSDTDGRAQISLEELARAVGRSEDDIDNILASERERNAIERFKASIEKTPVNA